MSLRHFQLPGNLHLPLMVMVVCLSSIGSTPCKAQVAEIATVGAILNKLSSDLQTAEDKAIAGGIILEIGAGGEIALAIQQAKAAYANSLKQTMANLNAKEQATINSLRSLVDDFSNRNIRNIEKRVRGLIHDMPFSKHFPQVFTFGPRYVVGNQDPKSPDVEFTLDGDFIDVAKPGYEPTAILKDKKYKAVVKSTDQVSFRFPATLFVGKANKVVTEYITIDIPYSHGITDDKLAHSEFRLPISTLPPIIGKIKIITTCKETTTIRQQVTSPEMRQDSAQDDIKDGGEHADLAIHSWAADAGWRVIPASVTYKMIWSQGKEGFEKDWWFSRNISTLQKAVLCFSTEHHRIGTSGKIRFKITFTEEKDILKDTTTVHDVPLNWGDSKVFTIPACATWKGSYVGFDGTTKEFTAPFDNPFLKVTQSGSVITISAVP